MYNFVLFNLSYKFLLNKAADCGIPAFLKFKFDLSDLMLLRLCFIFVVFAAVREAAQRGHNVWHAAGECPVLHSGNSWREPLVTNSRTCRSEELCLRHPQVLPQ